MTLPSRLRAAAAIAAAALAVVGCTTDDASAPTSSPSASTPTAAQATSATVDLPDGLSALQAWRLPKDVHPNPNGVHSSSRHAFFGLDIPSLREGGTLDPDQHTQYAVLDFASGAVTLRETTKPGAISDLGVFVTAGETDHLVRLEIEPRPDTECAGDSPDQCWTWQLRAETAADASGDQIAAATQPGSPFAIPQPVATGNGVAWLEVTDPAADEARLQVWSPGAKPRTIASKLPTGRLTVEGEAVWVTPDDPNRAEAIKVALKGGAVTRTALPQHSQMAVPTGSDVAYVRDSESASSAKVMAAPISDPDRGRSLLTAPSVYQLISAGSGTVIASTEKGYQLLGKVNAPLPVDTLTGIQRDEDRLNLLTGPSDAPDTIVVATLAP